MDNKKAKRKKLSAGIILYRIKDGRLEVYISHPGGPYHKNKDDGHWSIPKGEPDDDDKDMLQTALREFQEEIGFVPEGEFIPLGIITQKGGKEVYGWGVEGDLPEGFELKSNVFLLEWPPRSGRMQEFPEVDRAEFFSIEDAKVKIKEAQIPLFDRLVKHLSEKG